MDAVSTPLPVVKATAEWNITLIMTTMISNSSAKSQESTLLIGSSWFEYEDWTERTPLLWRVASPLVLVLGTFGNVMTILVLRTMLSDASGFPLLFLALAVSDLMLLYLWTMPNWIGIQFGRWVVNANTVSCKLIHWLRFSAQTLSAWFLSAMTAQRAINIVCPIVMRRFKPRRLALIAIVVLVPTSLVLCSYFLHAFKYEIHDHGLSSESGDQRFHWVCTLAKDEAVSAFMWLGLVSNCLLPFIILIICNSLMIRTVIQLNRQVHAHKHEGRKSTESPEIHTTSRKKAGSHESHAKSRVTLTLIAVSAAFIVLTLPYYVILFMKGKGLRTSGLYNFFYYFADLLHATNSAINFFLYILTGTKFRQEVKRMLHRAVLAPCINSFVCRGADRRAINRASGGAPANEMVTHCAGSALKPKSSDL